jgi:hypothetical protein
MKNIEIPSAPLFSLCERNENSPKNIKIGKKNAFNEIKSSKIPFVDTKNDKNLMNQKLNVNNHEKDETEINNFDISFFLSKDLKEKIESGDEPINNGEIEFCSNGILSYFFNKNNINFPKGDGICKNVNNSFINSNQNLNEINKVNNYSPLNTINANQFKIINNCYNNNNRNNDHNIFLQDNDIFVQIQKQFNFNLPQNTLNENSNKYSLNENFINPINLNYNQINYNFQFPSFDAQNNIGYNQNLLKYQPKRIIDNFTLEMFGKKGWICKFCNNFNYETRTICNRCHNKKKAKKLKKIKNLFSKDRSKKKRKNGWYCNYCGNYNYSFRFNCNRCKLPK